MHEHQIAVRGRAALGSRRALILAIFLLPASQALAQETSRQIPFILTADPSIAPGTTFTPRVRLWDAATGGTMMIDAPPSSSK